MTHCKTHDCNFTVYSGEYCPRCKHALKKSIEIDLQKLKDELVDDMYDEQIAFYIELIAETNNFSK